MGTQDGAKEEEVNSSQGESYWLLLHSENIESYETSEEITSK